MSTEKLIWDIQEAHIDWDEHDIARELLANHDDDIEWEAILAAYVRTCLRHRATRIEEEARPLVTAMSARVATMQTQRTATPPLADWAAVANAPAQQDGPELKAIRSLMAQRFSYDDKGNSVTWHWSTAEMQRLRAGMQRSKATGLTRSAELHEAAANLIEDMGVTYFGEIPEAVAATIFVQQDKAELAATA